MEEKNTLLDWNSIILDWETTIQDWNEEVKPLEDITLKPLDV